MRLPFETIAAWARDEPNFALTSHLRMNKTSQVGKAISKSYNSTHEEDPLAFSRSLDSI